MHFKAAQISATELSPNEMAMINEYALSPLEPEEVFAFKVSMAGNDLDRDFELFPYATLQKFALLFVGRTVVKDHDHRSDNQIARIYSTNLVEGEPMRMTKGGEIYTELIAKCYMVKTASNADLIAEIKAGIRKEVSLGCRIGKAICSICSKDNVKSYCNHFPGKEYRGETCYFSLEDPTDAYELSFVAIPAQQHAGTVKSYGEKPYSAEEAGAAEAEQPAEDEVQDGSATLTTGLNHEEEQDRLTINRVQGEVQEGSGSHPTELNPDEDEKRLTVNQVQEQVQEGSAPSSTGLNPEEDETRLTINQVQDQVQEGSAGSSTESNPEQDQARLTVNQVQDGEQEGSDAPATELNPEESAEAEESSSDDAAAGDDNAQEGEVTSKALDDFADKLKHMRERLDALGDSLEKIEATILEITSKGAGNRPDEGKAPSSPEQAKQRPEQEGEQAAEQAERLTVNQVQELVQSSSEP
ncbi:MAG: hypothetical protein ACI36V_08870, partial [Coriobacteriales bacterium]